MQISYFPMQISQGETSWLPGGAAAWNRQRSRVHVTQTCECASTLGKGFWRGCILSDVHVRDLRPTYLIWCTYLVCREHMCTRAAVHWRRISGVHGSTESTRKRTRAHRQGSVLCCRENVVSSFRQEWDVCLSRETKYEKQLHQVQCFKNYFKSPTIPLHRIPTIRRAIVCNPEKLNIGVLAFCRW